MRFIVFSFLILGWVFYEMSGGADFEPRKSRVSVAETVSEKPTETVSAERETAKSILPEKSEKLDVTKTAERVMTPTVAEPSEMADATPPQKQETENLARVRTSLSQGLTLTPDANPTQLTLASLEQGLAGIQTENNNEVTQAAIIADPEPVPVAPPADIREVTGTRVNMRDGPGTIYPVVARLNIGHKVEVLSESGTGWLRLRVLPERQLGWISASLISKSAR